MYMVVGIRLAGETLGRVCRTPPQTTFVPSTGKLKVLSGNSPILVLEKRPVIPHVDGGGECTPTRWPLQV